MSLEELEQAFRAREQQAGRPQIIISMHVAEEDIRALRPRLEAQGESLSEHVRGLIRANVQTL